MMPAPTNKTASDVWWRHLQYLCNLAVPSAAVKKCLSLIQIERDRSASLSPVHVLLVASCPTAVVGKVSEIVVDAVNRQFGWTVAHVGNEISKVTPPITDSDASSAVVVKSIVTRITTAVDHVNPRIVSAASLSVSRVSMLGAIVDFGHCDLLQGCCVK